MSATHTDQPQKKGGKGNFSGAKCTRVMSISAHCVSSCSGQSHSLNQLHWVGYIFHHLLGARVSFRSKPLPESPNHTSTTHRKYPSVFHPKRCRKLAATVVERKLGNKSLTVTVTDATFDGSLLDLFTPLPCPEPPSSVFCPFCHPCPVSQLFTRVTGTAGLTCSGRTSK